MKNKMTDLRNHLFATIEALLANDADMDVGKAKAIAELGTVLVDSARAENELIGMLRRDPYAIGIKGTGFLELEPLGKIEKLEQLAAMHPTAEKPT